MKFFSGSFHDLVIQISKHIIYQHLQVLVPKNKGESGGNETKDNRQLKLLFSREKKFVKSFQAKCQLQQRNSVQNIYIAVYHAIQYF